MESQWRGWYFEVFGRIRSGVEVIVVLLEFLRGLVV